MRAEEAGQHVTESRNFRGIPSWPGDAYKGYCHSLTHAEAVAECAQLTEQYRRMWQSEAFGLAKVHSVLQFLRAKKIPFILTGTYGIAAWTGRPRATRDVNILTRAGRNHSRAANTLRTEFPSLETRQVAEGIDFFLPGKKERLIDVAYPHRRDLAETLETSLWVQDGGLRYRVPTLEAALANKYGAMLTSSREFVQRMQDLVDFCYMVRHSLDDGRQPIHLKKLKALGEKVKPGGGNEVLRFVQEAQSDKLPDLNSLISI